MHDLNDQIEDFIFHCRYEKNLSFNSIRAYRIDLEQFTGFISSESGYNHKSQIDRDCIKNNLPVPFFSFFFLGLCKFSVIIRAEMV
jgi:site-specific recombinase XerD